MSLHRQWPTVAQLKPAVRASLDCKHARVRDVLDELVAAARAEAGPGVDPVDAWGSMSFRVCDRLAEHGAGGREGYAMALLAAAVLRLAGAQSPQLREVE